MFWNAVFQVGIFLAIVTALSVPLGLYMARVFEHEPTFLDPVLAPLERLIYRVCRVRPASEMTWGEYAVAMLLFSMVGMLVLYAMQRLQAFLPLNPQKFAGVAPDLAFNTAASFTTNTNWQAYGGESTMSYLTQMAGLAFHNFVSAAAGIAIAIAVIRGFVRRSARTLGNFWVDLTRATLWVLLPISLVFALVLVWQGVPENFSPYEQVKTVEGAAQVIAQGPVASQEIIKELGTNGGGFFNANSSHPYENPTPLTDLLELVAIFAIGAALTHTFGQMAGDRRQGWALFVVMALMFLMGVTPAIWAEQRGNPQFAALGLHQHASANQPRRQHGGQGGALRHRRLGAVGDRHHRHLVRRGQLDARQLHPARRPGAAAQHPDRRDHFRRRRLGALWDAGDGGAVGVHRGADGRADAGVSGQEDRRPRDEARDALHSDLSRRDPAAGRESRS